MARTASLIAMWTVFALAAALLSPASTAEAAGSLTDDTPGDAPALSVVADFNRDGIPDIARVTAPKDQPSAPHTLTILLGRADGTYEPMKSAPMLGHDPQAIAIGDFNRDGIPDVIVGDGDGTLIELLGDGSGNLTKAATVAHLGSIVSIAVGDFNHDGVLDLAVSDIGANAITVLLGSGTGAFHPLWSVALPTQGKAYFLATADFNGDGLLDLAITTEDEDEFQVLTGNGNGTFTFAPALSHLRDPKAHCVT